MWVHWYLVCAAQSRQPTSTKMTAKNPNCTLTLPRSAEASAGICTTATTRSETESDGGRGGGGGDDDDGGDDDGGDDDEEEMEEEMEDEKEKGFVSFLCPRAAVGL